MDRKALLIRKSADGKRAICIDLESYEEIYQYLTQDDRHRKKFLFITDIILAGLRNPDVYDKEDFNAKSKDVTAMKFFKGQENDRLYCREIVTDEGTFVVVAAHLLLRKKNQKLNAHQRALIEKIADYAYTIHEANP